MSGAKRKAEDTPPFSESLDMSIRSKEPRSKKISLANSDLDPESGVSFSPGPNDTQSGASQCPETTNSGYVTSTGGGTKGKESSRDAPESYGANIGQRYLKIYDYFSQENMEVRSVACPRDRGDAQDVSIDYCGYHLHRGGWLPLKSTVTSISGTISSREY